MVPPSQFYPTARLTRPHWMTYGLGWFQQDYEGRAVDFHTGSIDGMVAIIGLIPDERLGVYVLGERRPRRAATRAHAQGVRPLGPDAGEGRVTGARSFARSIGNARTQAVAAAKAAEAKRVTGTKPSLPLARYAGTYADSLYGEVTVRTAGDALRLKIGTLEGTLDHWQYDTFRITWDNRWQGKDLVTFVIGNDGAPSRVEIDGRTFGRADRGRLSRQRQTNCDWQHFPLRVAQPCVELFLDSR